MYGLPDPASDELRRDLDAGAIVLGGCCVSDDDPHWYCNACGHEWRRADTGTAR